MIQVNYCGYNYYNTDFDIIDRPKGSGDYLLLYLTPMNVLLNNKLVNAQAKVLLYTPNYRQWYQAVKDLVTVLFILTVMKNLLKNYPYP